MPLFPHVATLRLVIYTEDEITAHIVASKVAEAAEELLDPDDGDDVSLTEILPFTLEVSPQEIIDRLLQARNTLIRTRIKECFDAAKELDFIIHGLRRRVEIGDVPASYDYSHIFDVADAILNRKETPTD